MFIVLQTTSPLPPYLLDLYYPTISGWGCWLVFLGGLQTYFSLYLNQIPCFKHFLCHLGTVFTCAACTWHAGCLLLHPHIYPTYHHLPALACMLAHFALTHTCPFLRNRMDRDRTGPDCSLHHTTCHLPFPPTVLCLPYLLSPSSSKPYAPCHALLPRTLPYAAALPACFLPACPTHLPALLLHLPSYAHVCLPCLLDACLTDFSPNILLLHAHGGTVLRWTGGLFFIISLLLGQGHRHFGIG